MGPGDGFGGARRVAVGRRDTVIVVRHAAQADLLWRPERDRWAHELTDAALQALLEAAMALYAGAVQLHPSRVDYVRWAACMRACDLCCRSDLLAGQ